jgi:hypothetical protein
MFIKHFKNFYVWGDYLKMTYFEANSSNVYLHNSIMQHLFGCIRKKFWFFSTYKWNIPTIFPR